MRFPVAHASQPRETLHLVALLKKAYATLVTDLSRVPLRFTTILHFMALSRVKSRRRRARRSNSVGALRIPRVPIESASTSPTTL